MANFDSNDVSVLLGNGDGSFQTALTFAAGSSPVSVAVGDFNGDGKLDLAVANRGSNDVSVLLGNGDGTFQAALTFAAGTGPTSVAVGDFNGDGTPDLAVATSGSSGVSVLLGNGDGTFGAARTFPGRSGTSSVAVGDFNGDGKLDLAVANLVAGSGSVSVLLGNGDGTFQAALTTGTGGSFAASVAVGDFDGDGKLDLAVANSGSRNVSVLLGKGDGTFPVSTSTVAASTSVTISASYGSGTRTASLTVRPPVLSSLRLTPTSVVGGPLGSSTGAVTLNGPAPSGGALVSLSSSNAAATVPASVTVREGATSATFTVKTSLVIFSRAVRISASYNSTTRRANLAVRSAVPTL